MVVDSPDQRFFEQAIFIVRNDAAGEGVTARELVEEARRQARDEARQMMAQAEEEAARLTRETLEQAARDCEAMKAEARGRLDETARWIAEKVVRR